MLTWPDIIDYSNNGNPQPDRRVEKPESEWKNQLTPEQFRITRQKGTERSFSGELCYAYDPGIYSCICCHTNLFDSTIKFDSGTGWPSFTQPIKRNAVKYEADHSFGMTRVEIMCNTCDAHLGHVFPDGPAPSKLRYCVNSESIKLDKEAS
ncbi:MAG: peptide-methionine (R)-S-oxide reductase MsrB [Bacteroidota bacterium]